MILRDYQERAVEDIRAAFRDGAHSVALQSPTGSGKTAIFAYIAGQAALKRRRVWILVNRRQLVAQASRALQEVGLSHGVVAAGMASDRSNSVQVCSVQSLARRLKTVGAVDLIVVDECDFVMARTYRDILAARPEARVLGVSGTVCRLDGRGLGDVFERLIVGPSIGALVTAGYLARTVVYAPPVVADLSGLRIRAGDYEQEVIAGRMDRPRITGDAIDHYRRICDRAPAIVFCVNLKHCEHVAADFRAAGYRAQRIDGTMSDAERDGLLADLGSGRVDVLTSCDLISRGTDVPIVTAAILLRPTASLAVFLQAVGRVMRPAPGKTTAIVLDHVGNVLRHGLPETEREWTLEGKRRKAGTTDGVMPMRQCPKCFACHRPAPVCPHCAHVYVAKPRVLEEVAGELVPVTAVSLPPLRQELGRARTREALEAIAKQRGYNRRWIDHVLRARQRRPMVQWGAR